MRPSETDLSRQQFQVKDAAVKVVPEFHSSIDVRRSRQDYVRRSLGRAADNSIPIIGNGLDRVDARQLPKIRRR